MKNVNNNSPEVLRPVARAYLFDVDGVITDPEEKKVLYPEILDQIVKLLEAGNPVAFNTGRSTEWVVERVINPLKEKAKDASVFKNVFVVGEKGATWINFLENGELEHGKDEALSLPQELKDKIKHLIDSKYSSYAFYDDSKEIMVTAEMNDGLKIEEFETPKNAIMAEIEKIISESPYSKDFRVLKTTIDAEVEHVSSGKNLGAKKILDWLKEKGIKPDRFITFGDSTSDIAMAIELKNQGLSVDFVFVGTVQIQEEPGINYIFTRNHFSAGTLEYLKAEQLASN